MSIEMCPKGSGLPVHRCPDCVREGAAKAMAWLDQSGAIVLGDTVDHEVVHVHLTTNPQAQEWLDAIPETARETIRREVALELAAAGQRIKQRLVLARQGQPSC
jgi:hypothetical protein